MVRLFTREKVSVFLCVFRLVGFNLPDIVQNSSDRSTCAEGRQLCAPNAMDWPLVTVSQFVLWDHCIAIRSQWIHGPAKERLVSGKLRGNSFVQILSKYLVKVIVLSNELGYISIEIEFFEFDYIYLFQPL